MGWEWTQGTTSALATGLAKLLLYPTHTFQAHRGSFESCMFILAIQPSTKPNPSASPIVPPLFLNRTRMPK